MQYDLTDYTQELDYERRELESQEYHDFLDSLNHENGEIYESEANS